MEKGLIEMRFIEYWEQYKPGDTTAVTRGQAAIWEAKGVAVRVRAAHDSTKPIDRRHSVTKGA